MPLMSSYAIYKIATSPFECPCASRCRARPVFLVLHTLHPFDPAFFRQYDSSFI